jgi:tellurite resistance protein
MSVSPVTASESVAAPAASQRPRVPLNTLGISFGLSGLAGTWSAAQALLHAPSAVEDVLWIIAALIWVLTLVRYGAGSTWRQVGEDLRHPVLGPFAALAPTAGSLFGARLADELPVAGEVVVWCMLAAWAAFGSWFISQLLTVPRSSATLHGGYFLPTVAASLIAAQSAAYTGHLVLAMVLLAPGLLFWMLLGGMLVVRLATGPELPTPLLPTLAIFSAPPAVAGNAWWVIAGPHENSAHLLLLGTMAALLLPHVFLIRRYLRGPFTLGYWALTFTTAASGTYGVRLLSLVGGATGTTLGWLCVGVATVIIGAIAVRSLQLVLRRKR